MNIETMINFGMRFCSNALAYIQRALMGRILVNLKLAASGSDLPCADVSESSLIEQRFTARRPAGGPRRPAGAAAGATGRWGRLAWARPGAHGPVLPSLECLARKRVLSAQPF